MPGNNILPSFEAFEAAFNAGKSQLLRLEIIADLDTPVSAYLKLTQGGDNTFLLESVEGGEVLGRYSAIGWQPDLIWTHDLKTGDRAALQTLKDYVAQARIDETHGDVPPMLSSGLFGYMGYDMVRLAESTVPDTLPDELDIPDSIMMRPVMMAVFDNIRHVLHLATPVRDHQGNTGKAAGAVYREAVDRLMQARDRLANTSLGDALAKPTALSLPLQVTGNMDEAAYSAIVTRAKEDIMAGEIFQVVLSQRFTAPFDLSSAALYRSLRRMNPSPFLVLMNVGGFSLVASSPEIMVRVRKGDVTIRPIAGTRPRGKDKEHDQALAEELLADPKERAEHLMLLDLGRNDVGRVAATGSVRVTQSFTVERYSHVMHIVSNVEGRLKQNVHPLDALFAGFPAGTVSGAPKVRAMQIIDELEKTRRGFYAGCIGYLDGNGDVDTCIALRTALLKDGKIYIQSGAGIVADSVPSSEYMECVNKAKALVRAAEDALSLSLPAQAN